ncbi:MAG: tetratricopeptide repeat protein [Bacteroidota bacterium]
MIQNDPANAVALTNRGILKYKINDYDGAVADHTLAIENNPRMGDAFLNRGIAKEMMRDRQGARQDWIRAFELGIKEAKEYLQ